MRIINVIGYEGLYAVTDDGRIYSLKRGEEIKPEVNEYGYLMVSLSKNNHKYTVAVHKAVYYSYHQLTRTDNLVIDHIDGDKTNNHLSNLRKITTRENTSRAKNSKYGRGVCYYKHLDKYGANISIDGVSYHLGVYETSKDASDAYWTALDAYEKHGELPYKRDRNYKKCPQCGRVLPLSAFYAVRGHGHPGPCRECQRANREAARAARQ